MDYAQIARDARRRRDELLSELKKIDALIDSATALAAMGSLASAASPVAKPRAARMGNPTREAVRAILQERGRPIPTRELVPLVVGRGVVVGGKDHIATLSARLSNAPEFHLHRGIGWWFTDTPVPGHVTMFEEAGAETPAGPAPASSTSQGGSEDAAALASDPDRQ